MTLGPIFVRELVTSTRRWRRFGHRVSYATLMLVLLSMNYGTWYWVLEGRFSIGMMSWFARTAFGVLAVLQVVLTFTHVPALLSRSIAGEKDRKTLGLLLTTDLTSVEIVRDKLVSGLLRVGATLAAGLPVMLLLVPLGGIDPRWVGMVYVGSASMAFFLAGFSLLCSAVERTERRAVSLSVLFFMSWFMAPMMLAILGPIQFRRVYSWIKPVNDWLLASSPLGLVLNFMGIVPKGGLVDSFAWMVGLQTAAGLVLTLWAIVALRPAFRRQVGEGGPGFRRRSKPWRPPRRPPCGDDPVLWKDMHTGRPGPVARLIGVVFLLCLLIPLGVTTWKLGAPAFMETLVHGYSSQTGTTKGQGMDFMVRLAAPNLLSSNQAPDSAREDFNAFLRIVTVGIECILILLLTSTTVEGISTERTKDTWTGLLATPLTGEEILRAKRRAVIWKTRGGLSLPVVLWTIGLLAGAVHPLGLLAAMIGLGLTVWFVTGWGSYCGLVYAEPTTAGNVGIGLVLVLLASGVLPMALPAGLSTVWLGTGSPPFQSWLMLVSYRDVSIAFQTGAFPALAMAAIPTEEGVARVAAAWGLNIALLAAGGALFRRAASRRFDDVAGRPRPGSRQGRRRDSPQRHKEHKGNTKNSVM